MKKVFPTPATKPSFVYIQSARAKAYVFGALILLVSCTSTQVRWETLRSITLFSTPSQTLASTMSSVKSYSLRGQEVP